MPTVQKITDRIKSFEDACDILSITSTDIIPFKGDNAEQLAANALCKLMAIARALNEGWKPDWDNTRQYKYYPWFYMDKPGFRFADTLYVVANTYSSGGSRLCFRTEELAEYAGTQFTDLYQQLLN